MRHARVRFGMTTLLVSVLVVGVAIVVALRMPSTADVLPGLSMEAILLLVIGFVLAGVIGSRLLFGR